MKKINQDSLKFLYLFSGVFLLTSTIFLIFTTLIGYSTFKTKINSDTYTIATKVEMNSHYSSDTKSGTSIMYSPIFFYNVNGKEYTCSISSSSSIKPRIDNNKIYYKSQDPKYCISEYEITENIIFISIYYIISMPFFIIGLYLLITALKKRSVIKNLEKNGKLIKNIPCNISNSIITVNNQPGYIIEVEYSGLKFKSETKFNIDTTRKTADLLIDPLNSKNYFVDFDIEQIQIL